MTTEKSGQILL